MAFKQLIERLISAISRRKSFDPAVFNDEVANNTQWTACKSGGTNICTRRLVQVTPMRMEFRSTLSAKLFYGSFIVMGLAVIVAFVYPKMQNGLFTLDADVIFPVLFGAVSLITGGLMYYFGSKPIVFDGGRMYFWKGHKVPDIYRQSSKAKTCTSFNYIRGIQIISEYCGGNKSSYYSYELNLILEDATRINVVDHGSIDKLRQDAEKLARFLGKPVWDATLE